MTLDADFNTPAHIDRDEAIRDYDDGFDERADFDPIGDGDLTRVPGDWCWPCWVQIQRGGCDEHRDERAAYFGRWTA